MAGEKHSDLEQENTALKRSQVQLASDLKEEKILVRNLLGTIKNYERLLRLEQLDGPSGVPEKDDEVIDKHTKRHDSWSILCSSIVLLDEECAELTRTVARLLEKCKKFEKLSENSAKKICNLNMRIERLDAIICGQKIDCWLVK